MRSHNYTSNLVDTAAAAANAGTCLEDGNSEETSSNVFNNVAEAVKEVFYLSIFAQARLYSRTYIILLF